MGTVPVPHTWIAGDDATSTVMQTLTDAILYLLGSTTSGGSRRALALMRQTVVQSIAVSGTWTALLLDSEDVDYDNGHSTVTNTDRYTAATTGWHDVGSGCPFAANATGRRGVRYTTAPAATPNTSTPVNGGQAIMATTAAGNAEVPGKNMGVFLNAGDILRIEAIQESTAALNTVVAAPAQPMLYVEWRSN